jgi:hypothetical protein
LQVTTMAVCMTQPQPPMRWTTKCERQSKRGQFPEFKLQNPFTQDPAAGVQGS